MPMYEQLPKDPVMLLSFINTQLRDNYASFAAFAEAYPADADTVVASLRTIDYTYDPKRNQFVVNLCRLIPQVISDTLPVRVKLRHVRPEHRTVARLQNMRHLMHHHIFQTKRRLMQQRQINIDMMRPDITGTPACFHLTDRNAGNPNSHHRFPLCHQSFCLCFQLPFCRSLSALLKASLVPEFSPIASYFLLYFLIQSIRSFANA